MTFRTILRIRFADEDHARIVYYPRFFHFFHTAFEDFFESEGVPYRVCLDEGVGWPAVHAEADYASPVRFGDDLEISVDVERVHVHGGGGGEVRHARRLRRADSLVVQLAADHETEVIAVAIGEVDLDPIHRTPDSPAMRRDWATRRPPRPTCATVTP